MLISAVTSFKKEVALRSNDGGLQRLNVDLLFYNNPQSFASQNPAPFKGSF